MDIDSFLGVLKLLGIALSGILSLVAATVNLRSRRGLLTRWGRINLAGIIFGLFVSLAAQLIENGQKQDETLKSLDEIQRILHPMGQVRAGFTIQIDDSTPAAKGLENAIQQIVGSLQSDPCWSQQFCFPQPGMITTNHPQEAAKGGPARVSVGKGSPIIPTAGASDLDVKDLTERTLTFQFYKQGGFVPSPESRPESSDINWLTAGTPPPDLKLMMDTNIASDGFMDLEFNVDTGVLLQSSRFVNTIIWSQTGTIASILDIANSNLVVTGSNVRNGTLQLKCIELEIQKGRSVFIAGDKMRVAKIKPYTDPIYFYTFPESLDVLSASCL